MRTIKLTQNQVAIVSYDDYEWASQWKWYAHREHSGFYVIRNVGGRKTRKQIYLHREILARKLGRPLKRGEQTDHINKDTLDNRRVNLRLATHAQNQRNRKMQKNNTSGYMGVHWDKQYKKWKAAIRVDGRLIYLGRFYDPEDASHAYDEAALKYHGRFATTNGE